MKTVYKALMEVDGMLESLTTLGANLTYVEGQITYAPEGSMGIFVEETLDRAKWMGKGNGGYKAGKLVVYEVTPLGNKMPLTAHTFGDLLRYPAILLGKEVWTDKPKEPTELERLCEARTLLGGDIKTYNRTGLHFCPEGRKYSLYWDENAWTLYEGDRGKVFYTNRVSRVAEFVEQDKPKRPEPKFKVGDEVDGVSSYAKGLKGLVIKEVFWSADRGLGGTPSYWLYKCNDTINYEGGMLELVPKEEWVDVTKECELSMSCFHNRISVRHGGAERVLLANKAYRWRCIDGKFSDPNYRVDLEDSGDYPCGHFRVLKKV